MNPSASRAFAAECLGTALLLVAIVGSGIMAERLSGGNVGVALLANAIATGAALVMLIETFGPVSGAHFNPAVSVALVLRGHFSRAGLAGHLAAQLIGAVAGVGVAHLMFDMPVLEAGTKIRDGIGQWAGEIVATFTLLTVILSGLRHRPQALPYTVALTITGAYWFTSSTSFANPVVTLARSLTDSFAGIRPADVAGFILAQLVGMGLAVAFDCWLVARPVAQPASAPAAHAAPQQSPSGFRP